MNGSSICIMRKVHSGPSRFISVSYTHLDVYKRQLRTCTVSGLKNARDLMEDILRGEAEYDFVEVMACPGGCVGGGGQPMTDGFEMADVRGPKLYQLDEKRPLRFSPVSYTHLRYPDPLHDGTE